MTPDYDVEQWIDLAVYDLQTAEAMLASQRYLYVLFTCQQAVEKMLKALIVSVTGRFPRRTHNLVQLAEDAELQLKDEQKRFMEKLGLYYIETRYPEEVNRLAGEIDREIAANIFSETKELISWLENQMS